MYRPGEGEIPPSTTSATSLHSSSGYSETSVKASTNPLISLFPPAYRNPVKETEGKKDRIALSYEQQQIVDSFLNDYKNNIRKTYGHSVAFIAAFMLLVYDDQSQIGKRRKQSASGTDHNLYLSPFCPFKLVKRPLIIKYRQENTAFSVYRTVLEGSICLPFTAWTYGKS
mgnify:CR=1 FL=1